MKKNTGFTLVEAAITVTIIGILATAAVPAYQYYVAQAQVSESMEMMQGAKSKVEQSVIKSNSCIPSTGATEQGKYGVLTVSGAVKSTATQNPNTALKTGCVLSYKVNADSVSKSTAGKLVVGDLFNNGSISKSSSTTVEDRLLPKEFKTLTEGAITATGAPSAGANASIAVSPRLLTTPQTTNNELTDKLGNNPTTDTKSPPATGGATGGTTGGTTGVGSYTAANFTPAVGDELVDAWSMWYEARVGWGKKSLTKYEGDGFAYYSYGSYYFNNTYISPPSFPNQGDLSPSVINLNGSSNVEVLQMLTYFEGMLDYPGYANKTYQAAITLSKNVGSNFLLEYQGTQYNFTYHNSSYNGSTFVYFNKGAIPNFNKGFSNVKFISTK